MAHDRDSRSDRHEAWRNVRELLCVRLDALGDVLMTTPALHAAKASAPGRRVTLLTSPGGAEAARLAPDVDEVLVYEAPWVKATPPRIDSGPDRDWIRRLASRDFDAAVIFTVYSQNPLPAAMLCYLADIPLRLTHCRENPYQLLSDWIEEPEPGATVRHEVRRQLDLVGAVGWRAEQERLRMSVPADAAARVGARLEALRLDTGRPWAVVHCGASAASRRYPAHRYAEVVRALAREHGWRIVMTGTAGERERIERVAALAGVPVISLAGRLSLAELAALLERAPLLISNNTGPVHVAAAMGTPVVDLYALTNPQHAPWQVPSRVLFQDVPCRSCYRSVCPEGHHLCLNGVPTERVIESALTLTGSGGRASDAAGDATTQEMPVPREGGRFAAAGRGR